MSYFHRTLRGSLLTGLSFLAHAAAASPDAATLLFEGTRDVKAKINVVCVAIARELAAFVWAIATNPAITAA